MTTTRRRVLFGAAVIASFAAGASFPTAYSSLESEATRIASQRRRCPDLGWLRVRGLMLPVVAIDRLETPPLPGIPPIETLGALTRTTRATLLLLFADLSDREAIVRDIEAQLALLRLRLAP